MSITNIFIARHGETEYNRLNRIQGQGIDAPLNKTGRLQAQAVANCLKSEPIDYIFSSSLKRSIETAEIVASSLQLDEVNSYAELDEMNFGAIEGRPIHEISSELGELSENWKAGKAEFALHKGESPAEVLHRALTRMKLLLKEHHGFNILLILHGRLIRILLSEWLGYGLARMHEIEHCNGALYHFQLADGKLNPIYLKRTDHLNGTDW